MQIEDDYTQDDGESDQDHGEHDVVDNNRDAEGRLGDPVSQQEHEDCQSDEDRNGESHLLSCGRQGKFGELIMTAKQKVLLRWVLFHVDKGKLEHITTFDWSCVLSCA